MTSRSRLFPCLRYRDPHAAVEFLVEAFGFERSSSETAGHSSEPHAEFHAEMRLGDGLVFVGALDADAIAAGRTVSGGAASIYASVAYVDAHHDKAVAAGAIVTSPPADTPSGRREYACRDLEGYEWRFGSYDPLGSEEI